MKATNSFEGWGMRIVFVVSILLFGFNGRIIYAKIMLFSLICKFLHKNID